MTRKSRILIAAIFSASGLALYLSVLGASGRLGAVAFTNEIISNSLIVVVATMVGGYVTAPLFGRPGWSGLIISILGAAAATCLGAALFAIIPGWPTVIRSVLAGADTMRALQSLVVIPVLGVAFLAASMYFTPIVAVVWGAGAALTHFAARAIRRRAARSAGQSLK